MSNGDQIRDFISDNDLAEMITNIALQFPSAGLINICSGNPVTVKEQVQKWCDKLDSKIELQLGAFPYSSFEPHSFWGSRAKYDALVQGK